jgi:hypothetical protein
MKTLKINFVAAIAILGLLFAFISESSYSNISTSKYELNESSGVWTPVSGTQGIDYECRESVNTCTAMFPSQVNPNDQENDAYPGTADPSDIVEGDYDLL